MAFDQSLLSRDVVHFLNDHHRDGGVWGSDIGLSTFFFTKIAVTGYFFPSIYDVIRRFCLVILNILQMLDDVTDVGQHNTA